MGIIGYNYYMKQEEILSRIADLEKEIARLPLGSITKKEINGREYYYHRVTTDGKRKETYISFDDVTKMSEEIKERKRLEAELKSLSKQVKTVNENSLNFKTKVVTGLALKSLVALSAAYKRRYCIEKLRDYVFNYSGEKVFVLFGLRRTGKTTMIRQLISEMNQDIFNKTAFVQIKSGNALSDVDNDLKILENNGFKYVFIDEVTLMDDFIDGAALFSDIYACSGMKVVLSGTDSLGFLFSEDDQLYDRCFMLHTTYISYKEFEEVLGLRGIEEYIHYGGTMSIGGINYNRESTFASLESTNDYIDSAIAKNIQHSLALYQDGGHFRGLTELYDAGELTNVINRAVEDINHRFTRKVIESIFKSHDLSLTSVNLLKDRNEPIDLKKNINIEQVTKDIKDALDILDIEERKNLINPGQLLQIKEYLNLLDMIAEIDLEYLPDISKNSKITVVTQPGLRYAQAVAILDSLLKDEKFMELSAKQRKTIENRLLSEIQGRMMKEIILLETKISRSNKKVFKLQFTIGEFDMVVCDPEELTVELYEIKYSKECAKEQSRHLTDEEKCAMVTHRYGDIVGRYVIYRGEHTVFNDIEYLNVEEYLKSL